MKTLFHSGVVFSVVSVVFGAVLSGCASAPPSSALTRKLDDQWSGYDRARALILSRYSDPALPLDRRIVSRKEWEAALAPQYPMTNDDLDFLKKSQAHRIETAHLKALRDSAWDLRRLKNPAEFCALLPKGGMLHIHPSGALNRSTVEKLLKKNNPKIPFQEIARDFSTQGEHPFLYPSEVEWLRKQPGNLHFAQLSKKSRRRFVDLFFLPLGNHPFGRFDAVFRFISLAIQSWEDQETVYLDFAKRAAAEKVSYVEFTTGGLNSETLPKYAALARRIYDETGVTIRFNHAFYRLKPAAGLAEETEDLLKTPINSSPLAGIDLIADETLTPALENGQVPYAMVLSAVHNRKSQLHRTMHAGELGDVRNPRDAMILGAERLGHGVKLGDDPVAMEYAVAHHIGVEVNLTSNLRLQAVESLETHPYLNYLRLGIPVSLSTDDEGIIETDIDQECRTALAKSDVTYVELKEMALNSIDTSFLTPDEKKPLLEKLKAQYADFEKHLATLF